MRSNDYGQLGFGPIAASVSIDELIKSLRLQFEQSLLNDPVYIGNLPVRLGKTSTGHGGYRYWFKCPNCDLRVAKLFFGENTIGCRHCMSVRYPSSRYKGMVEESVFKQSGDNTHV